MHMPPTILHHYNDYGGVMEAGHVFTIEPIYLMRHGEF
jgi:methionyl aminopeptidase